jgi:hypothetical protein
MGCLIEYLLTYSRSPIRNFEQDTWSVARPARVARVGRLRVGEERRIYHRTSEERISVMALLQGRRIQDNLAVVPNTPALLIRCFPSDQNTHGFPWMLMVKSV